MFITLKLISALLTTELFNSHTYSHMHYRFILFDPLKPERRHGDLVVRGSDCRARGQGFHPHSDRSVVSLNKIYTFTCTSQKVLKIIHRKRWLCPDMTEKLLTGTLSLNQNKQKLKPDFNFISTDLRVSFPWRCFHVINLLE